ncbi:MAG: DUF3429 domain-containing protein [Geminicoccaceae bacterium]
MSQASAVTPPPPAPATVPRAAWVYGLGGLIPFTFCALLIWLVDAELAGFLAQVLRAWGALILTFLGGVHWGLAIAGYGGQAADHQRLGIAIAPSLLAGLALLVPLALGFVMLAGGFVTLYAIDRACVATGEAPGWYSRLRTPLSAIVVVCMALGALFAL